MKKTKDKKFILTYDSIKSILDNQIIPKHRELFYKLDKAKTTNSYYVMFFYGEAYVTARVSDHSSKIGALGIVIKENTTKKEVLSMLEDRIIALKTKYKGYLFGKFKKEVKNI